jgi:hypothetical protein
MEIGELLELDTTDPSLVLRVALTELAQEENSLLRNSLREKLTVIVLQSMQSKMRFFIQTDPNMKVGLFTSPVLRAIGV